MANQTLSLSIVLRAVNQLGGPMRSALRSIQDVNRVAEQARGLRTLSSDMRSLGESMQRVGAISLGAGIGGAAALGLTALPGQAIEAQHELRQIGNVAGLTNTQLREANVALRLLSRDVNQYQNDLIGGLGILTSKGLEFEASMAALPAIGRTATAMTADIGDLSRSSFAMMQNLRILPSELRAALGVAAEAGQQGAFELRNMAQHFDALTANAQKLGVQGVAGVSQLGAALQVALLGAGSPAQAANNLENFLSKITMPETRRNFAAMGVDLKREFARAAESADPLLEVIRLVNRTTQGGDPFAVGELFGDKQVLDFLNPVLANLERYVEIRDKAFASGQSGKLIDENFAAMLTTAREQARLLRINMAALAMPRLEPALRALNGVLGAINRNPALQELVLGTVLFGVAAGGTLLALGTMVRLGGAAVSTWASLRVGLAAVTAGLRGTTAGLEGGQLLLGRLGLRSRAVGLGVGQTGSRVRSLNQALRQMLGIQRLVDAMQYRGGFFNLLRFQALRARLGVLQAAAATRVWLVALPGRFLAGAAAARTWTIAQLAAARASVVSGAALRVLVLGVRALALSVFSIPVVGWIAGALTVAAFLIYKYWRPITGFFRGLWRGIREGAEPVMPVLMRLALPVRLVIGWVGRLIGWIGRLLSPVDDVGNAAESLGLRWGRVIGGMLAAVVSLPGRFLAAGIGMMTSLWQGIKSGAGPVIELIAGVAQRIRDFWPFSPAKVGPLRDLHRVRILETVAETVRPAPLVGAMRAATAAALTLGPIAVPARAEARAGLGEFREQTAAVVRFVDAGGAARSGGIRGGEGSPIEVTLEYSPTYNLGAGADRGLIEQLRSVDAVQREELRRYVARLVREALDRRARTSFSEEQ